MIGVREVGGKRDQQNFIELLRYCFQGQAGQNLFPLTGGAKAWGAFNGDQLVAGLVENPYSVNLSGTKVSMLGIGGVASLPEARNGGSVRRLHEAALRNGKERGYAVSALHPFSFSFYGKFGFGNIGPCYRNIIPPELIAVNDPPPDYSVSNADSRALSAEIHPTWYSAFWSRYDFSDARSAAGLGERLARKVEKGSYLRACLDKNGDAVGMLLYRIDKTGEYAQALEVDTMAWKDRNAYGALMHFLWTHRGQCDSIEINWPSEEFLPCSMQEPRYKRIPSYHWMARPVDIKNVLELKAVSTGFAEQISISIDDPALPENSGTYTVRGEEVLFSHQEDSSALPLSVFSSLLFGYLSVDEAALIADLPFDVEVASKLFAKRRIFLTEDF